LPAFLGGPGLSCSRYILQYCDDDAVHEGTSCSLVESKWVSTREQEHARNMAVLHLTPCTEPELLHCPSPKFPIQYKEECMYYCIRYVAYIMLTCCMCRSHDVVYLLFLAVQNFQYFRIGMVWLRLTSLHDGQCHLQSAASGLLSVPCTMTNYGDSSFTVSGLTVWNSLPAALGLDMSLSVFRTWLKTLLMSQATMPVTVDIAHLLFFNFLFEFLPYK